MADNIETATSNTAGESFVEKIEEKLHLHHHDNPDDRHDNADGHHDSSSSSSSDSEPEKTTSSTGSTVTDKIYRLFGREKPVHQVLGGGKAADVCLWRNRKISASVLATATAIWVLFELLEYHLLTLVCHILIFSLAILFLWANATTFIHKSRPRIPEVSLPERPFLDFASAVTFEINRGFAILRQIASGRQLKKFLAAIAVLWVLSVLGSCYNFLTLLYTGFFLLHTVPVLYEKYEDKVDSFAEKASTEIKRGYAVANEKYLSKIPKGALKGKKLA